MRKIFIIIVIGALFSATGCKTTEANYKAAYETAYKKKYDTGDSLSSAGLKNSDIPKPMAFGADTLMVRTEPVGISKDGGGELKPLGKYCVVTASFRQLFNARSMRDRLAAIGYEGAIVIHNRASLYYVVAESTNIPAEAGATVEKLKTDTALSLKPPFPYVLRPAHLVR